MSVLITACCVVAALLVVLTLCSARIYENWSNYPPKPVTKKRIWMLWLQGWDKAPPIACEVRASYERWNPGWTIECVSESDLSRYVTIPYLASVPTAQAKSDVIRLSLLDKHGGVWADATMLCLAPLDTYIYEALTPSGFWMYHGREECTGPASWFMASVPGSTIARKWRSACDAHWSRPRNGGDLDYFWMDALFAQLYKSDMSFADSWDRVPHMCCEDAGQAHMLAGRMLCKDADKQLIINANPPYVLKLSHHGLPNDTAFLLGDHNMGVAIARSRNLALAPGKHFFGPSRVDHAQDPWESRLVVVFADCGHDLNAALNLCRNVGAQAVVYDKCSFCATVPYGVRCRPLSNVGRESETFLRFVLQHYTNLPDELVLTAANMGKHDRITRLTALLTGPRDTTSCVAYGEYDFVLDEYEGMDLNRASVRPFGSWFERYIGPWRPDGDNGACWNGIMRTTRERILRHPKQFFVRLLAELSTGNAPEAVHYFERSMAAIF